jgi:hypothetical protein
MGDINIQLPAQGHKETDWKLISSGVTKYKNKIIGTILWNIYLHKRI